MIKLLHGFDGSCPHDESGITQESRNTFRIYPGLRRIKGISEEAPGMGSRLSLRLENDSEAPEPACLLVDWENPKRMSGHDIGYIRHDEDREWTMVSGLRTDETTIEYRVEPAGGITHFGLFPEYNYSCCEDFIGRMEEQGVESRLAGKSGDGRSIRMLVLPSENKKAPNFLIQARDHAYETAGSYCMEGIAGFLLSGAPLSEYIRSKFNFYLVPMTNPDGVYNGMSRLTWERGADMNRVHTVPDEAHSALKGVMDSVKPSVHMNIHNWTNKFLDGLLSNEESIASRILAHFPADSKHFKRWKVQTLRDYLSGMNAREVPKKNKSWKDYCREQFNGTGVNFEFPWFGLNTSDMREKGKRALCAYALSAVEENQL